MERNFSLRRAAFALAHGNKQLEPEATIIKRTAEKFNRSTLSGDLLFPVETRAIYTASDHPIKEVKGVVEKGEAALLLPLDKTVLKKAGATFLTGLTSDIFYPEHTGLKAFWGDEGIHEPQVGPNNNWYLWSATLCDYVDSGFVALEGEEDPALNNEGLWIVHTDEGAIVTEIKGKSENEKALKAGGSFKKGKKLSPKRLTSYLEVSTGLLAQDGIGLDEAFKEMLANAVLQKLEQTVFSFISGATNIPDGLFANTESMGPISWENIVSMEGDLADVDALQGELAYITHPSLLTKAKTTLKDVSGGGGFIANGRVNDYPAFRTSNVSTELGSGGDEYGIIFGNWADLVIGQWGPIEITTNPYSRLRDGMVEIVVNSYWDFGMRRKESFSIASMK